MYVNKYRGLGHEIGDAKNIAEALKMAGLSWKVQEEILEVPIKKAEGYQRFQAKGWKALVRPDKNLTEGYRVLDIVSNGYEVTQNAEIMDLFEEFAKLGDMKLETAGAINGGERIFAIAKLSGEFHFPGVSDAKRIDHGAGRIEADDATYLKVLMGSGHKSGIPLTFDVVAERQICTNGAIITKEAGRFRFIHKSKLTDEDREKIVAFVEAAKAAFEDYKEKATILRGCNFSDEVNRAFVVELMQKSLLVKAIEATDDRINHIFTHREATSIERGKVLLDFITNTDEYRLKPEDFKLPVRQVLIGVVNQPGADLAEGTAWGTYNAVTNYVDHTRGRTPDTGLEYAMYGQGAVLKANALELAVEYTQRLAV
jgi:hypothetical protein